jgi:hypothetical protein
MPDWDLGKGGDITNLVRHSCQAGEHSVTRLREIVDLGSSLLARDSLPSEYSASGEICTVHRMRK